MENKNVKDTRVEDLIKKTETLLDRCGIGDLSDVRYAIKNLADLLDCTTELAVAGCQNYYIGNPDLRALKSAAHSMHAAVLTLDMLED